MIHFQRFYIYTSVSIENVENRFQSVLRTWPATQPAWDREIHPWCLLCFVIVWHANLSSISESWTETPQIGWSPYNLHQSLCQMMPQPCGIAWRLHWHCLVQQKAQRLARLVPSCLASRTIARAAPWQAPRIKRGSEEHIPTKYGAIAIKTWDDQGSHSKSFRCTDQNHS